MKWTWGPEAAGANRTRFKLWAPDRQALTLEIAGAASVPMTKTDDGWHVAEAAAGPGARYRFRISDELAVPDPASRLQLGGVHGWSVVQDDPAAFRWSETGWRGRPWETAIIQELHVGVLGGFAGVADRLPELADLGITAVELMPIAPCGGTRNWGYDGVLPYAVAENLGSPDMLKAMIDRAHGLGLMVLLDVVYNHFGPDGNYLGAYASAFFDHHAPTPWGEAVAVSRAPARRFFIENALMWLREYRFDGLRFDAVHAIADDGFLDDMAAEIRSAVEPGREVHLILENERNDARRLGPGRYDAQWNDDFHNSAHVLLTGEHEAYYADFVDDPAAKLARCLAEGFAYQGETSINHGGEPRGTPSHGLPPTCFVAFLQNHDQIGNRALGERLTQLADKPKLRAATALLLLCPQIPLIFMGDEAGSRSPFLFFTDFHDELADAVREGRRREFRKFAAFADPEARAKIPDPNAEETFARSVPLPGPDAAEWRGLYRELIRLRTGFIIPRLRGAQSVDARPIGERGVHASWRMGDNAILSIAVNLGDEEIAFPEMPGDMLFSDGAPRTGTGVEARLHIP